MVEIVEFWLNFEFKHLLLILYSYININLSIFMLVFLNTLIKKKEISNILIKLKIIISLFKIKL